MIYLVDTNVLLRYAQAADPLNPQVVAAVQTMWARGDDLWTAPQNMIEMWNVATRPLANNRLGLSTVQAEQYLLQLEQLFPLVPDVSVVFNHWKRLVVQYGVSGLPAHDARLVALMYAHGIYRVLTMNTRDFARYAPEGIVAVDPLTI